MTVSNDPREARKTIEAVERLDRELLANPPAPHLNAIAYVTKSPTQHEILGQFEAVLATYETDRDNGRFAYGAWSRNIAEVKATGIYPPLLFAHERHDVDSILGRITSMREDPGLGLVITGQIDTTHTVGMKVAEGLLTNRISAMSVGFISTEWHYEDDGKVRVFDTAEVTEGSFVATPAQRGARVLSAKATKDSFAQPSDGELPESSRLFRHLFGWHGYPVSGLVSRTPNELGELHRSLHADGRGSHSVSDIRVPDDQRAPLPGKEAALLAELADLTAVAKAAKGSGELSPDAQAFVAQAQAAYRAEHKAERERFELWVENSKRAAAMRGLSFDDEVEQDRREREAWVYDRGVIEGEVHRIPIDADGPEGSVRIDWDDLHSGNVGGDVR